MTLGVWRDPQHLLPSTQRSCGDRLSLSRSISISSLKRGLWASLPAGHKRSPPPIGLHAAPGGELQRSARPGSHPTPRLRARRRWLPTPTPPVPWRPSSPHASSSRTRRLPHCPHQTRGWGSRQGPERLFFLGDELTILASEECRGRGSGLPPGRPRKALRVPRPR